VNLGGGLDSLDDDAGKSAKGARPAFGKGRAAAGDGAGTVVAPDRFVESIIHEAVATSHLEQTCAPALT
jgi:hypothetical protein